MRPVNQVPLSLIEMNCSPLASSRHPDSPPKPRNRELTISPLRNSSAPKRVRARSRVSKDGMGRALTSIDTGAAAENSSGGVCACAAAGTSPAAAEARKRRRVRCLRIGVCIVGIEPFQSVISGLDQAIHLLRKTLLKRDGYAGQARV